MRLTTQHNVHANFYSDKFYKLHYSDTALYSARAIIALLRKYINFDSVIDIGCGVGQNLKACRDSGASIIRGVDGSWVKSDLLMIPSECFTQFDLSQPNLKAKIPEKSFDLTISTEVAEHIDEKYSDIFVDNLTSFSEVILFSAAIPHQGGTHHVNEQWPSYWIKKFNARGFIPVDCIRSKIWNDNEIQLWYRQNLLIFVKKDALDKYESLKQESNNPVNDVVHPNIYEQHFCYSNLGFKTHCKNIFWGIVYVIPAFFRAIKRRLP